MQLATIVATFLVFAGAVLAAGSASAQATTDGGAVETQEEPGAGATTGAASSNAAPRRKPIEEIVIQAGESDSASDFEAGDSVAAFDASDLEALGAQSVADLAAFTPNLEIVTSGATTPTFFIRGVGLNDFSANSTGAVSIYQNDVPLNAPALQLGTLYDVEAVNILRGPQGVGPFRNASAGAIKIYARKPSGEFGGYLTQSYGNYDLMDYEGAVEVPIYEDMLSGRFAFRLVEHDGWMRNGCGNAPAVADRSLSRSASGTTVRFGPDGKPLSLCGELVKGTNPRPMPSPIAENLPSRVNDANNWSARGTLLFQPTLDMEWLLTAQGSRRDEQSRLGQSIGTFDTAYDPECLAGLPPGQVQIPSVNKVCQLARGVLGGADIGGYRNWEVKKRRIELNPCLNPDGTNNGTCTSGELFIARNNASLQAAEELADLDSEPWRGDFNRVGSTTNDVWGLSLKGDVVLGDSVYMTTVSGYNTYDRVIDLDLDFSPNQLVEFVTADDGWQLTQDLSFSGQVSENVPIHWEIGGFYLGEVLNVHIDNYLDPRISQIQAREYTQTLDSVGAWASVAWDFWEDFTLDGGFRYNWEQKEMDYILFRSSGAIPDSQVRTWQAPTGTVRLTYRFRDDTHAYWKYTRGWKGGHFNASGTGNASDTEIIEAAEPETIDAFEAGLRGSWFGGALGASFAAFHYNYENYQIFTARQLLAAPPEFVILNASKAEVYGAELDLVARPIPGMYLQARLSWLESQFLDFVQINQETESCGNQCVSILSREIQNTGNPLLNSPNYKVSLTAEQTIPLSRYGSVTARWDGAWTDDINFDASAGRGVPNKDGEQFLPENTIGQRAYWIHNLRLSYRSPDGNVEIAGWVRNLTDQSYKTFAFDGSSFLQTTIYFVGEPRMFGGTLTVNF